MTQVQQTIVRSATPQEQKEIRALFDSRLRGLGFGRAMNGGVKKDVTRFADLLISYLLGTSDIWPLALGDRPEYQLPITEAAAEVITAYYRQRTLPAVVAQQLERVQDQFALAA